MIKQKVTFKNVFMALYIFAIIALLVLPMLKLTIRFIPIILFTVPFIIVYLLQKKRNRIVILFTVISLLMLFIFSYLINSPLNLNASINLSIILYLCFIPFFIFDYLINNQNRFEIKFVIYATLLLFIYILVVTFREISINPTVTRALAIGNNDDEFLIEMRMKNVGGFGFSYAVGMFIPYITSILFEKQGIKKLPFLAILIVLFVYVLLSQYTTLLIITCVFCFAVIIIDSKNIVTKFVLLTVVLLFLFNIINILEFLGTKLPFKQLSYHFWLMYISFETGEETTSRLAAARRCIGLFKAHPIFGANTLDSYNAYVVNHGHSSYLPILAGNGIIGFLLYCTPLALISKNLIKLNEKNIGNVLVIVMYLILGIINPTHNVFELSVVVFMLIPLIEIYKNEFKEEHYV